MATKSKTVDPVADFVTSTQRGFVAFGAAQECAMKAWMRAVTRQAELTRETFSDCMTATAGMGLPASGQDGPEHMRRATLAAETWFRTWSSINDDLRHDLMEAADMMLAGVPAPLATSVNGAARKPASAH
jgi:hypothetical protein